MRWLPKGSRTETPTKTSNPYLYYFGVDTDDVMASILRHYEFKHLGETKWQKVSEKTVMEKLVDNFDPVTPILSRILRGEEIITIQGIYRKIHR
jgi:hypothetical protein